ncbi:hypothetical protein CC85DRAFT_326092 [Cutaneotrichosporon oleaginosum]|uniref:Uncharacterized protein n=1 Tax=Cutaneotrichosporon oleaginosum TaxID=879819 RepID=A0A0J0XUQ5_9TREE|nr:uncharacterized protein CC85DRAFT_326092 [Cutaneotrichosporon oleaginosum]KLT44808.1 hypothetical protein CC85DRAFT_326092 [Cutaneotrichosporon oleaginosum]TXT11947.1 hypothetical protein COLE_02357 [Cutaneotrichosporon oleaginosum]
MSLLRLTAQRAPALARSFSVSAARKDLIQDLYVNQLKAYKAPAKSADAHAQHVRSFAKPAVPAAPAVPSDLAGEMSKFDATEPTLGNNAAPTQAAAAESGGSAQQFLEAMEADLPKNEHH